MVRQEIVFACAEGLSPQVAARLVQRVEHYAASLHLECGGMRVRLNSLIGVLSLECRRGTPVIVTGEGEDARAAVEDVARFLAGE